MVAIQQDTTVQPGGVIHISSDKLTPGTRAQVTVVIDQPSPASLPSMSSLIGAAQRGAGKGGFKSAAEIDAFLQAERNSWR